MRDFTNEEIKEMREDFIALLRRVNRQNANIEGLINKLDESDFFYAPASTRYHNSCYGGLLAHLLNVYNNLEALVKMKKLEEVIPEESIIICGLLHDLSKMNFYAPSVRNKKVYSSDGSKFDDLGRFDWVSEKSWTVRPENERLVFGNHEENSEFMVRCYIPLKVEESAAILSHHAGMSSDSGTKNISGIYHRYPIANLLHVADMIASFMDEDTPEGL